MANPVAVVTGASSGIGVSIARVLAKRSYDLVLTARREDRLKTLAADLEKAHGIKAHVVVSDLGERDGAAQLIQSVADLGLTIEVLINNAGFGVHGPAIDQAPAKVAQMIDLNLTSVTTLTLHYAKEMAARKRGRILQTASIGAFQPSPYYAVYSATKTYVLFFSEAVNAELAGTGVTVTTMNPGLTDTEFHEVAAHPKPSWMKIVMMTADEVAEIGVRAMLKGRAVVTPGIANKLTALSVKLIPRSWAGALAGWMMRPAAEKALV